MKPKYEKIQIPSLPTEIKAMNGKSTKKLIKCAQDLSNELEKKQKPNSDTDSNTTK